MVKNKYIQASHILIVIFFLALEGCNRAEGDNNSDVADSVYIIEIDPNQKYQTVHNFGASDAWTCQFVGLWPDDKRNQVADWLFSMETDQNGQPKGIGLSLWRFNIGAGSSESTDISDEWRRSEGFLNNDGKTYDWSKQAGERWFLQAAKHRGVEKFLAFTNSPPVELTKNGKAYSSSSTQANITPSNYVAFAKFLADVVKHFHDEEKITFNYLSPFNEPQWDWTGNGQEGTPFANYEIFDVTKKLDSIITANNLPSSIKIGEAGKLNYLYETADKPNRGNQIEAFFHESSPTYMGNLPNVDRVISGHSYFTSAPVETMISVREKLKAKIQSASVPIEFWQSEYCILGDEEEINGVGKDLGINTALYVARLIHHDLTVANASAWQWWLAVSAYDYKDGLIYVDKNKTNGNIEDSKLLWALGNYSRFIRPGAIRVGVNGLNTNANNPIGLMVSSFVDEKTNKLITVAINYGYTEQNIQLNIKDGEVNSFVPYLTSGTEGEELMPLEPLKKGSSLTIPKRSIITLVGDL